jgi:hypothetical protein
MPLSMALLLPALLLLASQGAVVTDGLQLYGARSQTIRLPYAH